MSEQLIPRVGIGMWAKVYGSIPGKDSFTETFHFVPGDQVNLAENKISIDSPLGRALSGAKVGDKTQLETENEVMNLTVLDLGRG